MVFPPSHRECFLVEKEENVPSLPQKKLRCLQKIQPVCPSSFCLATKSSFLQHPNMLQKCWRTFPVHRKIGPGQSWTLGRECVCSEKMKLCIDTKQTFCCSYPWDRETFGEEVLCTWRLGGKVVVACDMTKVSCSMSCLRCFFSSTDHNICRSRFSFVVSFFSHNPIPRYSVSVRRCTC